MYEFYRKNRRKVAKGIDQYMLWKKAISGLLIAIKELVEERENGVYIKDFGYLCLEKAGTRRKKISPIKKQILQKYILSFMFDNPKLKKRYKYRSGKVDIVAQREHIPKYEAIIYNEQTKKQFKIK